MNSRDNLKLSLLLRLPWNRKIKERYDFARQQAPAIFGALLDTASYDEYKAGGKIFDNHVRSIKAIERLLLDPARFARLASYRHAFEREDTERVEEIESEFN